MQRPFISLSSFGSTICPFACGLPVLPSISDFIFFYSCVSKQWLSYNQRPKSSQSQCSMVFVDRCPLRSYFTAFPLSPFDACLARAGLTASCCFLPSCLISLERAGLAISVFFLWASGLSCLLYMSDAGDIIDDKARRLMVLMAQFEQQLHQTMDEHEQEQQEEVFAENHSGSPDDAFFDEVVCALQDIMLDEQFEHIQAQFMRAHCGQFEAGEENRPEYMLVFNLYQQQVEHFVQQQLQLKVPHFAMGRFVGLLESRTEQIDEQILDMVESFSEFESFKRVMLEYREFLRNEEQLRGLAIRSSRLG